MVFNTIDLVFGHYTRYGLIHEEDWTQWKYILDAYLEKKYVLGWWEANRHEFGTAFRVFTDGKVPATADNVCASVSDVVARTGSLEG